jgi:hypothetical protein
MKSNNIQPRYNSVNSITTVIPEKMIYHRFGVHDIGALRSWTHPAESRGTNPPESCSESDSSLLFTEIVYEFYWPFKAWSCRGVVGSEIKKLCACWVAEGFGQLRLTFQIRRDARDELDH